MFRVAKYLFYAAIVVLVLFLYWFLPKYSYVHKNPGYCAQLTKNFYYCGNEADLQETFNKQK